MAALALTKGLVNRAIDEFPSAGRAVFARWMRAITQRVLGIAPSGSATSEGDLNSLVPSDLTVSGWGTVAAGATNDPLDVVRLVEAPDGLSESFHLNYQSKAGANGLLDDYYFRLPSGTTSLDVAFWGILPQYGVAAPAGSQIVVIVTDAGSIVGRAFPVLTNGWVRTTFSVPAVGDRTYRIRVMMATTYGAGSGQLVPANGANAWMAGLTVTPRGTGPTWDASLFATDFYRHDANELTLSHNAAATPADWVRVDSPDPVFGLAHSVMARVTFESDASQVVVEHCAKSVVTAPSMARVRYQENGVPTETLLTEDGVRMHRFGSGVAGGKRIEIASQGHSDAAAINGVFLKALYRPAVSSFELILPTKPKVVLVFGNSVAAGTMSGAIYADGFTLTVEPFEIVNRDNATYLIVNESWAQRVKTQTLAARYIELIRRVNPDMVIWQGNDNDYAANVLIATLQTLLTTVQDAFLLDAIQWRLITNFTGPTPPISATRFTAPNGNGETLAQFDTMFGVFAAARVALGQDTKVFSGTNWLTVTPLTLPDGLHPSPIGTPEMATKFVAGIE